MIKDFQIGEWLVQPSTKTITRLGIEIEIEPKTMLLLCALAEAEGKVVSRQALFDKVWDNQIVSDNALNTCISSIRHHLKDEQNNQYIKTRPKLGYQLTVPVVWLVTQQKNLKQEHSFLASFLKRYWPFFLILVLIILPGYHYVIEKNTILPPFATEPKSTEPQTTNIGHQSRAHVVEIMKQLQNNLQLTKNTYLAQRNKRNELVKKLLERFPGSRNLSWNTLFLTGKYRSSEVG